MFALCVAFASCCFDSLFVKVAAGLLLFALPFVIFCFLVSASLFDCFDLLCLGLVVFDLLLITWFVLLWMVLWLYLLLGFDACYALAVCLFISGLV